MLSKKRTRDFDDLLAQLDAVFKPREPEWSPTPEELAHGNEVFARYKDEKPVAAIFKGWDAAQPWVDALVAAMKRDLFDPHGLKYDPGFSVALSMQRPYGLLRENEAGSTWPLQRRVWVDAMQPAVFVAATLAHELLHTAQPANWNNEVAHKGKFAEDIRTLGLDGPPRATLPGPAFEEWFKQHAPKPQEFV